MQNYVYTMVSFKFKREDDTRTGFHIHRISARMHVKLVRDSFNYICVTEYYQYLFNKQLKTNKEFKTIKK